MILILLVLIWILKETWRAITLCKKLNYLPLFFAIHVQIFFQVLCFFIAPKLLKAQDFIFVLCHILFVTLCQNVRYWCIENIFVVLGLEFYSGIILGMCQALARASSLKLAEIGLNWCSDLAPWTQSTCTQILEKPTVLHTEMLCSKNRKFKAN